tara:strand:+ start:684 stop:908 length:225 start_codon:yes stop_codon:yes gene_type:complete
MLASKTHKLDQRLAHCLRVLDGDLPEEDIRARAGVLAATVRGLAISARSGTSADKVRATAGMATRLTCGSAPRG